MAKFFEKEKPALGLINESYNSDHREVEVSHGSTSNLTSFYGSASDSSCIKILIDIFLVALFLLILVTLVYFWMDRIPNVSWYFLNGKKYVYKFVLCIVIMFGLLVLAVILIARNLKNLKCLFYCCLYTKKFQNLSRDSLTSSFLSQDTKWKNRNVKLFELAESDIVSLKQLLTDFKLEGGSHEWSFSSTQSSFRVQGAMNSYSAISFSVKIVLVGCPNAGKTSIFHRILYDQFSQHYTATLGVDLGHITLHLNPNHISNHVEIHLQIWDIAGSEKLSNLSHVIYKETTAFVITVDATDTNSLSASAPLLRDICNAMCQPYIAVFFNKVDLHSAKKNFLSRINETSKFNAYSLSAKSGEKVLENIVDVVVCAVLHEIEKLITDK